MLQDLFVTYINAWWRRFICDVYQCMVTTIYLCVMLHIHAWWRHFICDVDQCMVTKLYLWRYQCMVTTFYMWRVPMYGNDALSVTYTNTWWRRFLCDVYQAWWRHFFSMTYTHAWWRLFIRDVYQCLGLQNNDFDVAPNDDLSVMYVWN